MGCFSYMCSECDKPVCSDSFSGEHCILMLVEDGKVLEWMQGEYDSYGRVFKVPTKGLGPHGDETSYQWTVKDWGDIVDLHFGGCSYSGIAAYHSSCFDGDMENVCVSDDDPEQGWEEYQYPTGIARRELRSPRRHRGTPRNLKIAAVAALSKPPG